jgi:hypothetical protein
MKSVALIVCLMLAFMCMNVDSSSWSARRPIGTSATSSAPFPRSDYVSVTIGPYTYLYGGCTGNQFINYTCPSIDNKMFRYHFLSDTWLELTAGPIARFRYAAAASGLNIYYMGGRNTPDDAIINTVDVYNIGSNTWSTLPNAYVDSSDSVAFVLGDDLYLTGGYYANYTAIDTTQKLNAPKNPTPANQIFQSGLVPTKNVAAGDQNAVAISSTQAIVLGGFKNGDFCRPLNIVELYDSTSNSWTVLNSFITARGDSGLVYVGNKLILIGGETKIHQDECYLGSSICAGELCTYPVADVEGYDIATGVWSKQTTLARAGFRSSGTAYDYADPDTGKHVVIAYDIGGQSLPNSATYDEFIITADVDSLDITSYVYPGAANQILPFSSVLLILIAAALLAMQF